MTVAAAKSLAYGRVGTCFLYVSTKRPPTDSDWSEYMAWMQKSLPLTGSAQGIVIERGSGPNAAQRKQIAEVTGRVKFNVAVLTHSALARGVLTALNWFKQGYAPFGQDDLDGAIAYLKLEPVLGHQVKIMAQKFIMELDH